MLSRIRTLTMKKGTEHIRDCNKILSALFVISSAVIGRAEKPQISTIPKRTEKIIEKLRHITLKERVSLVKTLKNAKRARPANPPKISFEKNIAQICFGVMVILSFSTGTRL